MGGIEIIEEPNLLSLETEKKNQHPSLVLMKCRIVDVPVRLGAIILFLKPN